ncbi:MAG: hypothetical protein U0N20_08330, partial [Clostridium sp.]
MRKISIIALTFLIILCGCSSKDKEEKIDEVKEYRFASYYSWFLGKEYYEDLMSYQSSDNQTIDIGKEYGEKAYLDGEYLIVEASEQQKNALIAQNDKLLQQAIDEFSSIEKGFDVNVGDDYKTLSILMNQKSMQDVFSDDTFDTGINILGIINLINANRVLQTGDSNACVEVTIQNLNSGNIVSKALFPYESISLTDKDWEKSETEDVMISSKYEEYTRIEATIEEITEEKIIFQPSSEQQLYDDERLE